MATSKLLLVVATDHEGVAVVTSNTGVPVPVPVAPTEMAALASLEATESAIPKMRVSANLNNGAFIVITPRALDETPPSLAPKRGAPASTSQHKLSVSCLTTE